MQLVSDIDLVYPDLVRNHDFILSQNVLANIKEKILSKKYDAATTEVCQE